MKAPHSDLGVNTAYRHHVNMKMIWKKNQETAKPEYKKI